MQRHLQACCQTPGSSSQEGPVLVRGAGLHGQIMSQRTADALAFVKSGLAMHAAKGAVQGDEGAQNGLREAQAGPMLLVNRG